MIGTGDITTRAIEWAMRGLEERSQSIANNVANAEVPNYRASRVEFESQLRTAISRGDAGSAVGALVTRTGDPAGPNGNNVKLEDELVSLIETNLRQEAMVNAFNYKAGLIRAAMRSQ